MALRLRARIPPWARRVLLVLAGLALVGLIAWALLPKPVEVDVAEVELGPMQVTVDQDGETRVLERYVVYAPVSGTMRRILYDVGAPVGAGAVVARIAPPPAPLLDARAQAEALADVGAARARLTEASARLPAAEAALSLARQELARLQQAATLGAASCEEVDRAADTVTQRSAELSGLRAAADAARYELRRAEARAGSPGEASGSTVEVTSPVSGRIFTLTRESEGPVTAGEELFAVGDTSRLEVVVDVLTVDAVDIEPGAPATLYAWGGDLTLPAYVEQVEPSAFTEVSALGVEEQRVNVVLRFAHADALVDELGDGWRVEARIVTWAASSVVQVPESAVFRSDGGWAVFAVEGGRARLRPLVTGRRNGDVVQILDGLAPGERVVVYPGDQVDDGVRVTTRSVEAPSVVPQAQAIE